MRPREIFCLFWPLTLLDRYQGHLGAALILGGIDATGPSIYTIHPHGSVDRLPYTTMGSGSLAAMAVFEAGYKEDLSVSFLQFFFPVGCCYVVSRPGQVQCLNFMIFYCNQLGQIFSLAVVFPSGFSSSL